MLLAHHEIPWWQIIPLVPLIVSLAISQFQGRVKDNQQEG